MSFKYITYLQLWQTFCSAERDQLCNFVRGNYEEHFCENILNLNQRLMRCRLNVFLFLDMAAILFDGSGTICAILVVGIMGCSCENALN